VLPRGKPSGALKALELLAAYGFGRPPAKQELTGGNGEALFQPDPDNESAMRKLMVVFGQVAGGENAEAHHSEPEPGGG
jgi:hypothetical protein